MNQDHLVIGCGEVGTALATVLNCPNVDIHHTGRHVDTLHIAFPYGPEFIPEVHRYTLLHTPARVVIHSTVPPGTCDPFGWIHSPVRGRHPHLESGILTFPKPLGGGTPEDITVLTAAFRSVGVQVDVYPDARTTEIAKLVELAQLGVEVRVMKEIHAICDREDVLFDDVYTRFGTQYNTGYTALGETRFVKPVLTFTPGPLGGHCVAQNTPLLGSSFFNQLVRPVSRDGWTGDLA